MSLRLAVLALAAGTILTESTVESSIARKAFAVGELLPGKVYEFECVARAVDNNSTDTLAMSVRFGTSDTPASNTAIATSGAVNAEDNDICVIRGRIHVQTATRIVFSVFMNDPDAEGTAVKAYHKIFTSAAGTAYNLDICGKWSVSHADNEVQAEAFLIYEIA